MRRHVDREFVGRVRHKTLRAGSGNRTAGSHLRRLMVEPLESRHLLSTNVLHVDVDSVAPVPDGATWPSAYASLQGALDRAAALNADGNAANDIAQIWIAEGTYIPTKLSDADGDGTLDTDPRSATFSLLNGVSLYGGFAGTESTLDEREPAVDGVFPHETILSGDLGRNDAPDIATTDLLTNATRQENAFTVVTARDLARSTTFDALTITGGNASAPTGSTLEPNRSGGGLFLYSGTLTVSSSTVVGNSASDHGGGIFNYRGAMSIANSSVVRNSAIDYGGGIFTYDRTMSVTDSTVSLNSASQGAGIFSNCGTLTVTDSTISNNSAISINSTYGIYGGGIYSRGALSVVGSIISGNSASDYGGGIYIESRTLIVSNSTILGNSAGGSGGGIYIESGVLDVVNSTISGNSAISGGGIYHHRGTSTVANSTISGNSASGDGGGICQYHDNVTITNSTVSGNSAGGNGGGICQYYDNLTITNSTISDNSAGDRGGGIYRYDGALIVSSSIVATNQASTSKDIYGSLATGSDYNLIGVWTGGSLPGGHNFFGTLSSPLDLHLAPLGDYGGPTWTMPLLAGSRAIDAGNPAIANPPATDQRGFARIVDGNYDGLARIDIGAFEYVPPNRPATAAHDVYTTARNATLVVGAPGVLANDTDADGDVLTASVVDNAAFGTVTLSADGSFTYAPAADFIGVDSFSYVAHDGTSASNEATVTVTVGNWLGPITFRERGGIDPAGIDPWYGFETTHRGFITLETSSANFSVKLYDKNRVELAASSPANGRQRLDWQAGGPGEKCFFVVSAVDGTTGTVDLRLLNMVDPDGATLNVYGSEAADRFEFDAACIADPTAGPVVTVNGVGYTLGSPELATVSFNGGGGDDVAVLRGTAGDEVATLRPGEAWLGNVDWDVQATDVEDATIYGQGGHDAVTLYDSPGNDHFVGTPVYAAMNGDGFYSRAWNFAEMKAEAAAGGVDEAKFYDSPGDDTYTATPESSELAGPGYRAEARLFDGVHVYATAGGHDEAKFYDSPGNDMFVTTPTYAALFGAGFYNRAKYFESTSAYATAGGVDVAKLFDSPADDLFVATPTYAALSNPDYQQEYTHGYIHRANFFDGAHAYATAIGDDTDVAMLYDSPGDDTFYADPLEASLYKAGQYYNRARLFDAVHAYATAGGVDTALLSGSEGNDEFHADPVQAALFRTGNYYRRAKFFENVYADARGGDDDRAYLLDSPEVDLLQAEGNWARLSRTLSGEAIAYLLEAKAFDRVHARASTSGDTKSVADAAALDFLLDLEGPWETPAAPRDWWIPGGTARIMFVTV